ncbi:hypothetical protein [Nocardiopsis sp. FR4]|uniref:hypothetical protein n=1 Tax=Nocardiopsis sp. FR4 TaxID=2605985 RepID=UPI00135CD433|nr:hypothetical protein [Nocardiopsis sp. FR4]
MSATPSVAVLAALTTADPETGTLTLGTWPTLRSAEANGWIARTDPTDQTDRPDRFTITPEGEALKIPRGLHAEVDQYLVASRFPRLSFVAGHRLIDGRVATFTGKVSSYADMRTDKGHRRHLRIRVDTGPGRGAEVIVSPEDCVRLPKLTHGQAHALVSTRCGEPTTRDPRTYRSLVRKGLLTGTVDSARLTRTGALIAAALS